MFLDAIELPSHHSKLSDKNWNWDGETRVKAQGLKASLSSFETLAVFSITKNVLDEVRLLTARLKKRDQDIYSAYKIVHEVIENLERLRTTMDTTFNFWYDETLALDSRIGVDESVPKTFLQRNRSNVPSANPKEHYKRAIAIPLLDSFICQLRDRFEKDNVRSCELLCLIPSVFLDSNSSIELQNHLDELLYWSQDLPFSSSLAGELRQWQSLWENKSCSNDSSIPSNLLQSLIFCDPDSFPNIHQLLLIAFTLPIASA